MRILVTGHRGFIGSHLVRELKTHGHEVVGHDRAEGDLSQPGVLTGQLGNWNPDRVVHLAAQVGRLFGEDDLIHTVRSNATMTALVAHACGERRIPVLYASTSEVYGDHGSSICDENTPCLTPGNLYGITKYMGEEALRLYAPGGLRICRLSMPYGPGAPPGRGRRALDNFLWQAYHRQPITVHRGAERSWCWVGDTVRGLRLILEHGEHQVYNVGRDDAPISMLSLAERACDLTGADRLLIRLVPAPQHQTVVKRLSTDRLRALGWKPTVELADGLPRVLEWVKRFDKDGRRELAFA